MRFVLLLMASLSVTAFAQNSDSSKPAIQASGAFFALSVADIRSSSSWYAEKLGMKVVMRVEKKGDVPAVAVLEGGGLIVELIQRDRAMPLSQAAPKLKGPEDLYGIFKVGVVVKDFDKTVATLKLRGVEIAYGPYPRKDDQRANVIVKDNAGNPIQFFGE